MMLLIWNVSSESKKCVGVHSGEYFKEIFIEFENNKGQFHILSGKLSGKNDKNGRERRNDEGGSMSWVINQT